MEWEHITTDFVKELPLSKNNHNFSWEVVDRLMESTHCIPICKTNTVEELSKIYVAQVVKYHGHLWVLFQTEEHSSLFIFGDHCRNTWVQNWIWVHHIILNLMVGLSDVNQFLWDMLRTCILDFKGNWKDHLPLREFYYNNIYQSCNTLILEI